MKKTTGKHKRFAARKNLTVPSAPKMDLTQARALTSQPKNARWISTLS
jgi:hypothetical protein